MAILKMIVVRGGNIQISGVDTTRLNSESIRSATNVISQDPYLMPGTIRFNMDPPGAIVNDVIIQALTRVGLWELVEKQGGLEQAMNTSAWSAGQKQLFCLARAIAKKGKILILDEAMSSVDDETEATMQSIVDTEFKNVTVLAVIHRLSHIRKYDRVVVLDKGELVEFGEPEKLMMKGSRFAELWGSDSRYQ